MGPLNILIYLFICLKLVSVIGTEYTKKHNDNKHIEIFVDE